MAVETGAPQAKLDPNHIGVIGPRDMDENMPCASRLAKKAMTCWRVMKVPRNVKRAMGYCQSIVADKTMGMGDDGQIQVNENWPIIPRFMQAGCMASEESIQREGGMMVEMGEVRQACQCLMDGMRDGMDDVDANAKMGPDDGGYLGDDEDGFK